MAAFVLNPYLGDVNSGTAEGLKLYNKTINSRSEKIEINQDNVDIQTALTLNSNSPSKKDLKEDNCRLQIQRRYDKDTIIDPVPIPPWPPPSLLLSLFQRDELNRVIKRTTKQKAIVIFYSLEDKNRKKEEYLGLLDTGSTGGLISKELVDKYNFEYKNNNSTWDTNTGNFKTGKTTEITGLRFL